jgi:uncharacterized membrane protein
MDPRTIAALCYIPVAGCLVSIYALASEKFRGEDNLRFHAFQALYLFVGWLILDWGIKPFLWGGTRIANVLQLLLNILGIFMIIKTFRREDVRLPFVGDLAERSRHEQR